MTEPSRGTAPALPRHDRDFVDRCLWDLIVHAGQWRRLGRLYAAHVSSYERSSVVRDAVVSGRKCGLVIEGDRRRGYRLVGFRHPAAVYFLKPGPRRADSEAGDE